LILFGKLINLIPRIVGTVQCILKLIGNLNPHALTTVAQCPSFISRFSEQNLALRLMNN